MQKITILLVCLNFLIIKSYKLNYDTEIIEQITRLCVKQTGIERAIIDKVISTETLPRDNQLYKEFLSCSYKKQGYQTSVGDILIGNIKRFLTHFYRYEDLDVIDHCDEVDGHTHADIAFGALECILPRLQSLIPYPDK